MESRSPLRICSTQSCAYCLPPRTLSDSQRTLRTYFLMFLLQLGTMCSATLSAPAARSGRLRLSRANRVKRTFDLTSSVSPPSHTVPLRQLYTPTAQSHCAAMEPAKSLDYRNRCGISP